MQNQETKREIENFMYNIAWLRRQNKLSKRKMAELLKVSVQSLNKIESGNMPMGISMNVFFLVQKHFGVHPADQLRKRLGE